MIAQIFKSDKKDKRYTFILDDGMRIHFGDPRYQNFLMHRDENRKRLYILRHQKNEDWTKQGSRTAGFWSRWILWNLPTLPQSIRDTEQRFGIKIINNRLDL